MVNVLLVEGGLRSGNRGVNAITLGAMRCIRESCPSARFAIVGFTSPTSTKYADEIALGGSKVDVVEAQTSFHEGVRAVLHTFGTRKPVRDGALGLFWWADAVVDLSAGDGFGETYGSKVLLRHSIGKLIALNLGKPLAIFPQTIGPFRSQASRVLARYLLRRADLLCVREETSKAIVADLLRLEGKSICLPDMAFLLDKADALPPLGFFGESSDSLVPIGVNISGFLWSRSSRMYSKGRIAFDYRETVIRLIRTLAQETGRPIVLIPHVFSDNPSTSDLHAIREAKARLDDLGKRVLLPGEQFSAQEIKTLIGQCEFFVGSRMHACIAALSTQVPVVPVSYSHKFVGILKQFGIQDWIVDHKIASQEQAIDLVLSGYRHRDEIKEQIAAVLPQVQSEAMEAGRLFSQVLDRAHGYPTV